MIKKFCLEEIETKRQLASNNVQAIASITNSDLSEDFFLSYTYDEGEQIVTDGEFLQLPDTDLKYARVPLAFIIDGAITVNKNNKDTKKLEGGDFFGLFETANYIQTGKSRNIGDWSLRAQSKTRVVFFKEDFFRQASPAVEKFKKYLLHISRTDPVPQPITNMPLLDWVAEYTTDSRLHEHVIIAHTHLLQSNVPLFRHLAYLVGVNRIYVIGKPYSTIRDAYIEIVSAGIEVIPVHLKRGTPYSFAVKESIEILWHQVLEDQKINGFSKILILDDGGDIWTSIPWEKLGDVSIAGTEQTQRGITRIKETKLRLPPIISVATSGIKKEIESVFIAQASAKEIKKLINLKEKTIGILGMGNIGKSLLEEFANENIPCLFYDPQNVEGLPERIKSIDDLLNKSDIIVGTTGTDSLKAVPFERIFGKKVLISVSSSDIEFRSVLQFANSLEGDPFGDTEVVVHPNLNFTILNGGFPINFNREKDPTPYDQIVLTRCLLYIGLMQASLLLENEVVAKTGFYNLDTESQEKLLHEWFAKYPDVSVKFTLNDELSNIQRLNDVNFHVGPKVWN